MFFFVGDVRYRYEVVKAAMKSRMYEVSSFVFGGNIVLNGFLGKQRLHVHWKSHWKPL